VKDAVEKRVSADERGIKICDKEDYIRSKKKTQQQRKRILVVDFKAKEGVAKQESLGL